MNDQTRTPVVDFDVFASNTLADNNAAWEAVQAQCPVGWTAHNGGHWVISGYDAVAEAFRSWEVFSSARTDPQYASITISSSRIPPLIPEELDPAILYPIARTRQSERPELADAFIALVRSDEGKALLVSAGLEPVP